MEPVFVLRQTVVSVARDLEIAEIHQAMSFEAAEILLMSHRFDGCVLAIGDECREIKLISRVRSGESRSPQSMPMTVMISECDAEMAIVLRELQVSRILLKPFKVKTILETISSMAGLAPQPA